MTEEELSDLATSLGLVLQRQKDVYRVKDADGVIVAYDENQPGGWGLTLADVEAFLVGLTDAST